MTSQFRGKRGGLIGVKVSKMFRAPRPPPPPITSVFEMSLMPVLISVFCLFLKIVISIDQI